MTLAHREDDAEALLDWDYGRAGLIGDVRPGEKQIVDIFLQAPRKPGTYRVVLDVACELVSWFTPHGSCTMTYAIEV